MKALKFVLYGVAGLVVLAIVAAAGVALMVDGAFVKARLERAMKEKNRTLSIEGTPKLSLFPVAGIALGKAALSEPGSDKTFLALDSAEVAVRVMPLLYREVRLETLKVAGLRVNVLRAKDGRLNFADLAGGLEERPEAGETPRLRLGEAAIERAQVSYRDEASGQELVLGDFNLKTGRLDGATPGQVSLAGRVSGKRPDLDVKAQAAGAVRFDLGRQEIGLEGFSAKASGRIERDTLAAEFAAPKVEISPAKAAGSAVTASVQVKGPQRSFDAKLKIAAVEGSARALSIPSLVLDLATAVAGGAVKAHAEGTLKADLERGTASADLTAKLDESTIKAKLALAKFAPLVANFDLDIDRINVDRYAPPQKEASKVDERIDLSALKGPTAEGKVEIGALTVRRVKLSNVKTQVKLAGGRLELSPHSASLYGGTLAGSLAVDGNGNRVAAKETLQGVNVGPLLRDAADQDRLEGRGNVNLDVATAGATVPAMKKALGGTARVELKEGAVKGVNLAESFRDVKSVLGSKSAKAGDPAKKTDFSDITASFAIKNGVARNDDLQGKSPFIRLTGAGDLDIGNNAINYLAKASVVATSKGQGGQDLSHLAGVTVPVKLTGALDKPDWNVDYGELAAKSGVGKVLEKAGGAAGGVGEKIKGLFRR